LSEACVADTAMAGRAKAVFIVDGAYIRSGVDFLSGEVFCFRLLKYVQRVLRVENEQTFFFDGCPFKWFSKVTRGLAPRAALDKRDAFHQFLRSKRVTVHLCDYKRQSITGDTEGGELCSGWVQRGADCAIAMKMLETAYESSPIFRRRSCAESGHEPIKTIVLLAGDSDFSEAVDKCLTLKLKVAIVGFSKSIA